MAVTGLGRDEMCITHHDRPAVARCGTCHRPLCSECVLNTAEGRFCGRECADKAAKFRRSEARVEGGGGIRDWAKTAVYIAIFILALGALNKFGYKGNMPFIGSYLNCIPYLGR